MKVEREDAQVPISAMIDCVFLLLIYFVVTQKPLTEETLLGVDLPAPGKSRQEKPITLFTIDVAKVYPNDPEKDLKTYHVNGRAWNFEDLREQLIKTGEDDPEQTIIINCCPNAKHKKLIRLLDACAEAKLTKLNIVNDESVQFVPEK